MGRRRTTDLKRFGYEDSDNYTSYSGKSAGEFLDYLRNKPGDRTRRGRMNQMLRGK